MTALDELLTAMEDLPSNKIVQREDLECAVANVARKNCKPDSLAIRDGAIVFTLEGLLAFVFVCRNDPEATPKLKWLGDLVERAISEMGGAGQWVN